MIFMQMAHQHLCDLRRIDTCIKQIAMNLQNAILFITKTCVDNKEIIGSDDSERLYLNQQAANRTRLQVVFFGVKRDEAFGLVYRKSPFGQWNDLHSAKLMN